MTNLDAAQAAMAGGDEADALRYYQVLSDATLFLLLEREAEGERIAPRVFDLPDGPVILAADTEERLATMTAAQGPVAYAALPGRIVAQHLAGKGVSLGLNLGSGAPSEMLLPPEAMTFLTEMLEGARMTAPSGQPGDERLPEGVFTPRDLPDALTDALSFTFAGAAGLAREALLVAVRYDDGSHSHMLAVIGAHPAAEAPLARAVAEALAFSGLDAAALDVTFLAAGDPSLAKLRRAGHLFEFPPAPEPEAPATPAVPGSDPDRPPRLR